MNPLRKPIESRQNSNFKRWRDCLRPAGIREYGECLVMGEKIIADILALHGDRARALLVPHKYPDKEISEILAHRWQRKADHRPHPPGSEGLRNPFSGETPHQPLKPFSVFELTDSLFEDLDETGTHSPILVIEPAPLEETLLDREIQGLEVVLQLQDPANLGAAIRSATAFGAREVILLEGCAHPWTPKSIRSSAGASLSANLSKIKNSKLIFANSRAPGHFGLDMNGTSLIGFQWPKNARLFVGEEGQGLSGAFQGQKLSIPMSSTVESLNATVSLSIALYDRASKL